MTVGVSNSPNVHDVLHNQLYTLTRNRHLVSSYVFIVSSYVFIVSSYVFGEFVRVYMC